ncbi:MAG: lectin like domain-containing protein [Candidatus Kapabacteria bacterium]|nr:lectin like domain-containing protein [Candidatus Kapabacteria bacterium]
MKKHLNKLILIVFLITIQQFSIYAVIPEPQEPMLSQSFIEYLNSRANNIMPDFEGSAKNFGYIPIPYPKNTGILNDTKKEILHSTPPASFDLRNENSTTSVKNQGNCGSCWAFASIGSVESNWLINNYGTYDLSENNMKNCHNFLWSACDGGNSEMASSYLTLKGTITESDDSYRDYSQSCNSSVNPIAYISNLFYLPNRSNSGYEEILKNVIMQYGGVFTSMTWSERYYNSTAKTYRYTGTAVQNHAILLVGWNDNMTVTVNGRTSTGAWIAKNSWGSSWGDNGYFYIAYDDTRINGETAVWISRENSSSIEKIYYYDEVGAVRQIGFGSNTGYGLVKFTANANQTISKIGTWINSYNSTVSIEIYGNFQNNTLTNLLGSISNLSCEFPGYYTFDLDDPINISANTDFYIKIQYNTGNYRYPIPIERSISGYCSPNIETGKCWISNNGRTWLQTGSNTRYPYDVCIRAYATQNTNSSIEVLTLNPEQISSNSATLAGRVSANRIQVLNKGICWSRNSNPTVNQNRITNGSGTGTFSSSLENLNEGTTYYYRAFAITSNDTVYGDLSTFTTLALPTITDAEISNISSNSAALSSTVTNDGNANVTERGFYYSINQNFESGSYKISSGSGIGSFNASLSNLRPGQTYYVKSFATNSVGTVYSNLVSFTTNSIPPSVSTGNYSNLTSNSVTITGEVTDDGGSNVTERGICYSINQNPDYNSSKLQSGSGTGQFSCSIDNLSPGTTYYAKAYALNNNGISYGTQISFTTEQEQQQDQEQETDDDFEEQSEEIVEAPTIQDYNLTISELRSTSMSLYWTKGNGSGSFVVLRQDNPITSSEYPQANTVYSSFNTNFSQAPQIGNGKILYYGSANSLNITGLRATTRYYIRIFAYNGDPSTGTSVFNEETATNNPITFRTARYKQTFSDDQNDNFPYNLEKIYPNPANHQVNLDISVSESTNLLIELFDITGNRIITKNLDLNSIGLNSVSINTENIPSGNYIIKLSNGYDIILDNILIAH